MILCWSRHQFLRAYLDQKRTTLLWGHVAAFRYFEGVPWKIVDRLLDGAQGIRFAGESIRQSRSRRRMPPPTPPEKRPSSGEDDAQPAF